MIEQSIPSKKLIADCQLLAYTLMKRFVEKYYKNEEWNIIDDGDDDLPYTADIGYGTYFWSLPDIIYALYHGVPKEIVDWFYKYFLDSVFDKSLPKISFTNYVEMYWKPTDPLAVDN